MPDHLIKPARCKRFLHTPLLTAEVPGASPGAGKIPDHVKVACPPVKRIVVVRVHVGEPLFWSTSGLVEEAVPKTVIPQPRDPGCKSLVLRLFRPHGAKAAYLVVNQTIPERYRVRAPLTSLRSSIAEHPVDNRETGERYPAEEILIWHL